MPDGAFDEDAGDAWEEATRLATVNRFCLGEMGTGAADGGAADDHDWFYVDLPETLGATQVTYEVCPSEEKVAPWDPDIEGFVGTGLTDALGPGIPLGQANADAGCNTVNAQVPLTGLRLHVHVSRDAGAGTYLFRVILI